MCVKSVQEAEHPSHCSLIEQKAIEMRCLASSPRSRGFMLFDLE